MKIYFQPCTLQNQFPLEIDKDNCYVQIEETYLKYSILFTAEEPVDPDDKLQGLKKSRTNFKVKIKRSSVVGVEKSLGESGKRWVVLIIVLGITDALRIYYKTEEEASHMAHLLEKWIFEENPL